MRSIQHLRTVSRARNNFVLAQLLLSGCLIVGAAAMHDSDLEGQTFRAQLLCRWFLVTLSERSGRHYTSISGTRDSDWHIANAWPPN
ncbi:hypothetical protein FB45DRAFT_945261 [Roridomyces roridus]|uniref:Secreted protein n=1 Tax=Roridomyces roridus TaxID=1738132 RepID=A0AAD7B3L5_9AGAR|nr:hypothetical protein FB45DRAFT_945261 [Roridomyces roridus]